MGGMSNYRTKGEGRSQKVWTQWKKGDTSEENRVRKRDETFEMSWEENNERLCERSKEG